MKRIILMLVLALSFYGEMVADGEAAAQINLQHKKHNGGRPNVLDDEPNAYYDSNLQQIIIDGNGTVNYYDVNITSLTTWNLVISCLVNGSYDTIDISSLPADDYQIVISSIYNVYEGYFSNY